MNGAEPTSQCLRQEGEKQECSHDAIGEGASPAQALQHHLQGSHGIKWQSYDRRAVRLHTCSG